MKISTETSQKIKNMSFVCSLLVVSIHVVWCADNTFSLGWFIEQGVKQGIARIAVPFFFVVSGFFLAQHFDEEGWWKREVKKRLFSLVVPFFIWSTMALFLLTLTPLSIWSDFIANRPFGTNIVWLQDGFNWWEVFGFDLMDNPLLLPLWFVRNLLFFVLFGHIFKWGVTCFKIRWLVFLFIVECFRLHLPSVQVQEFLMWGISTNGLFYFSVGIFSQRFKLSLLSNKMAVYCGLIGVFLLISKMSGGIVFGEVYEQLVRRLTIPFMLYFVWHFMSTKQWPEWLTSCAFPIYLMHMFVFPYFNMILKSVFIIDILRAFLLFVGGIIVPICVTNLLRRCVPRVAVILFGGR